MLNRSAPLVSGPPVGRSVFLPSVRLPSVPTTDVLHQIRCLMGWVFFCIRSSFFRSPNIFNDFFGFLSIFADFRKAWPVFWWGCYSGSDPLVVRTFIGQCLFDPCFWSSQRPLNLSTALKVMPDLLSILLDSLFILPFFCCFYDFWWFSGASGKSLRMFGVAVVSPGLHSSANTETVAPTPIMLKPERDVGR